MGALNSTGKKRASTTGQVGDTREVLVWFSRLGERSKQGYANTCEQPTRCRLLEQPEEAEQGGARGKRFFSSFDRIHQPIESTSTEIKDNGHRDMYLRERGESPRPFHERRLSCPKKQKGVTFSYRRRPELPCRMLLCGV